MTGAIVTSTFQGMVKKRRRSFSDSSGGRGQRCFAVKGVFRYLWTYLDPPGRRKEWFECRIVRTDARDEAAARRAAHRVFSLETMSGKVADPEPMVQSITYLGIQRVLEFGEVGMEDNELWWEFVDQRPRIGERPPARRSKPEASRRGSSRTRS